MLNSSFVKNLISLIIIVVLVYGGYFYLTTNSSETDTLADNSIAVTSADGTTVSDPSDTAVSSSERFLALIQAVDRIDFKSVTLFQNQIFSSVLQDFRQALPNRPVVRLNPFAAMEANVRSTIYSDDIIGRKATPSLNSSSTLTGVSSTTATTTPGSGLR